MINLCLGFGKVTVSDIQPSYGPQSGGKPQFVALTEKPEIFKHMSEDKLKMPLNS